MGRIFKFYWLCLKEAWRGSIEVNPELRDNKIILKDIYGNKDWENLTVEPADLIKDFEKLKETAKDVPR
jgi:hypothetical protein